MPKRQKVCFSLDADYTEMLRVMMAYSGWRGTPSGYCAWVLRYNLSSDVADLGSPSMREVEVPSQVFRRARAELPRLSVFRW